MQFIQSMKKMWIEIKEKLRKRTGGVDQGTATLRAQNDKLLVVRRRRENYQ